MYRCEKSINPQPPKNILFLDLPFLDRSTEILGIRIICPFVNLSVLSHVIRVDVKLFSVYSRLVLFIGTVTGRALVMRRRR